MGQSLVQNYIHIIFATKYRTPVLLPPYEKELHAYLNDICFNCECPALIVNGHLDHVHILCKLSKNVSIMELVKKLKSNSSRWLKTKDSKLSNFRWQGGYAAYSVGMNYLDRVEKYIRNQKQHHAGKSFKKELIQLLNVNRIEYDEQYLWK